MSTLIDAVLAIVSGAVAGCLSSVYAAGPVARRQEAAKRRDHAQGQLHEMVTGYLGRLRAVGHPGRGIFPVDYADPAGREMLAEQILWQLPMLRPRSQERIRAALLGLVGVETLRLAEQRLGIPEFGRASAEVQAGQHEVIDRHTRLDYHDSTGCKQDIWRLCDREHYPQVKHDYGALGLLRLTASPPHSRIHDEVLAETTRLLGCIVGEVASNPQLPQRSDSAQTPISEHASPGV